MIEETRYNKHYYPEGSYWRPWLCADCHPAWYWWSAVLGGIGVWVALWLLVWVIPGISL